MKALFTKKKILKAFVLGFLLSLMCVLTFINHAPVPVNASFAETGEPVSEGLPSNDATDTDPGYLEGDLGGLTFRFDSDGTGSLSATLQILLILTLITLAPSILIMLTSFTRIIIVMHFLRTALGTQTTPPNQVLVGLSLFLTLFIMAPVFGRINTEAIRPLSSGDIGVEAKTSLYFVSSKRFLWIPIQSQSM